MRSWWPVALAAAAEALPEPAVAWPPLAWSAVVVPLVAWPWLAVFAVGVPPAFGVTGEAFGAGADGWLRPAAALERPSLASVAMA